MELFDPDSDRVRFFPPGKSAVGTGNDPGDKQAQAKEDATGRTQRTSQENGTAIGGVRYTGTDGDAQLPGLDNKVAAVGAGDVASTNGHANEEGKEDAEPGRNSAQKSVGEARAVSNGNGENGGTGADAAQRRGKTDNGASQVEKRKGDTSCKSAVVAENSVENADGKSAVGKDEGNKEGVRPARVEVDDGDSGCGGSNNGEELEWCSLSAVRIMRGPSIEELEKRKAAIEKWSTLGTGGGGDLDRNTAGRTEASGTSSVLGLVPQSGDKGMVQTPRKTATTTAVKMNATGKKKGSGGGRGGRGGRGGGGGGGRGGRGKGYSPRNSGKKPSVGQSLAIGALAAAVVGKIGSRPKVTTASTAAAAAAAGETGTVDVAPSSTV